jgi:TRAP-type C4-dicarboxylate transport system permease small subunit
MSIRYERFESFVNRASEWLNWVTVIGLAAMSVLTAADVIAAKIFHAPIVWAYEVTGLLGLIIVFFAVAYTQKIRGHIEIEFVSMHLPVCVQKISATIVALLGMAVFAFMSWQMLDFAFSLQAAGRITPIQKIPLFPFAYASTFCFVAVFLVLLLQFIQALVEVLKK